MISRRDFLQASMAASAIVGGSGFGNWAKLDAKQSLTQDQLLQFDTFGNVSLIHMTDIHAQLKPIYFREPEINLGVGANVGAVPHIQRLCVSCPRLRKDGWVGSHSDGHQIDPGCAP